MHDFIDAARRDAARERTLVVIGQRVKNRRVPDNKFYNDFDCEQIGPVPRKPAEYREPFQIDRDRIIYTAAFRRLQAKTQVFLSGEYDFYRTRLTHSIEVAQIGRSICQFLQTQDGSPLSRDFFVDPDLVEGVCLAHDLGHPPFGHAGERTLHQLMRREYGGFERNAQSLRMITETIYSDGQKRKGMNPTRAFLDGILKYKTLRSQTPEAPNHFLYDDQKRFVDFVFDGKTCDLAPGKALNDFRSIECQIMDWADDTAYSLNDLVDGIAAGFIRLENVERWAADHAQGSEAEHAEQILKAIRERKTEAVFGRKIGNFINACRLEEHTNLLSSTTNRYRFHLVIDPEFKREASFYKKLATNLLFRSPQLQQLEHKGDHILRRIFDTFEAQYLQETPPKMHLLDLRAEQQLCDAPSKEARARLICDHLAGMTDGFAVRTYKRLFDPDFGSIADLA